MKRQVWPSPFAQKLMFFLSERSAGCIIPPAGEKITPAKRKPAPFTVSPVTCMAPFDPLAPPATASITAVDLPPITESVITVHAPKLAPTFRSSNVLTTPDSDPLGFGAAGVPAIPFRSVTLRETFLVSAELAPTITSKIPGSTTRCISAFNIDNISGVMANSTVRFSPGFRWMRSKPFNCITGRVTEETRSCR